MARLSKAIMSPRSVPAVGFLCLAWAVVGYITGEVMSAAALAVVGIALLCLWRWEARCFAAAVVVALAPPVKSDHVKPYPDASVILVPPAQYNNQMGARYTGIFRRVLADHATIKAACTTLKNPNPLACAKFPKGRPATGPAPACTVYIPNNLPADLYKAVNTHEVAHCLNWRH